MDPDYVLFIKVVETGSLSSAGKALSISPAMMSKRIARLESRLGVHLLRRTTRKISLTDAGAQLHRDVSAILVALQNAEDRVTNQLRAVAGPLRVSAPTSFGRLHVAPLLSAFLETHPQIELQFDLSDTFVDLMTEPVDVAIRITRGIPSSLTGHYLMANRRILCASPTYIARYGVPAQLRDLDAHRLIATDGQSPWKLVNSHKMKSINFQSHVKTNSSEIVRELVLSGAGIALRSLWDVGEFLGRGELVPVLEEWEAPQDLAVYAVHLRAPGQPKAVDAFIEFLQTSFGNIGSK